AFGSFAAASRSVVKLNGLPSPPGNAPPGLTSENTTPTPALKLRILLSTVPSKRTRETTAADGPWFKIVSATRLPVPTKPSVTTSCDVAIEQSVALWLVMQSKESERARVSADGKASEPTSAAAESPETRRRDIGFLRAR